MKHFKALAPLSVELKLGERGSAQIILNWEGRAVLRLGLKALAAMYKDVVDAPAEDLAEATEEDEGAFAMARAYAAVRMKYTGKLVRYGPESKFWKFFAKAAQMAARLAVTPDDYCEAITTALTKFNPEQEIRVPWPSQLISEKAELWVGDLAAASRGNPHATATRKARAMRGVPLEQDDEYRAIRRRMSARKHTLADVAYMRARQREIYGEPKAWLDKFDSTAVDARKEKT